MTERSKNMMEEQYRIDLDGDGLIGARGQKISKSEDVAQVEMIAAEIDKADTDSNEKISREEWLARYGNDLLFNSYDINHDGLVDADEYIASSQREYGTNLFSVDGWLHLCVSHEGERPALRETLKAISGITFFIFIVGIVTEIYLKQSACNQTWDCDMRDCDMRDISLPRIGARLPCSCCFGTIILVDRNLMYIHAI